MNDHPYPRLVKRLSLFASIAAVSSVLIGLSLLAGTAKPLFTTVHFTWVEVSALAVLCAAMLSGFIAWIAFLVARSHAANADLERDVTERVQSEQMRERLAAIVESSDDAIISKTLDGTITAWNHGAEKIFGYTAAEMVGQSMRSLFPPERASEETEILAKIKRGLSVEHFETVRVRKDGQRIDVSVTISPIRDRAGAIVGASKVARDISERKLAEDRIKESEERFRLFAEHAPAAMAMFDREMRYLHVSRRWRSDYGLGDRDLRGVSHYELFPDLPERWKEVHRRALAGEVLREDNDRFDRADGSAQWIRWEVRPWFDLKGGIAGIVVFAEDTTERTQAEEALQRSDARRAFALENARLGEWELDLISLQASRSLQHNKIFGYESSLPEWSFDIFLGHVHPDDRERVRTDFQSCIRQAKRWDFECRIVWPNGEVHWIWACGNQRWDLSGKATTMSGIVEDITERKQAQEALRESEKRFHAMLNGIPQLAWMAHADGSIFWYNQRWFDYTGTSARQMEGWGWQSVHDPEVLPEVMEKWKISIAEGTAFEMEFPLRAADGHFGMFLTRVMPLKDSKGCVVRWFGTNTDISERKQAELRQAAQTAELARSRQALEKQSTMFQLVLDNMGEGLVAADRDGRFLIWNESAKRLLGRGPEDLGTEQWSSHYGCFQLDGVTPTPTDELPLVRSMRGESMQAELIVRHPAKKQNAFLEFVGRPVSDDGGSLRGAVVVFRDITDRKRAESELASQAEKLARQAEELLRSRNALERQTIMLQSVLDSMAEGLIVENTEGKFILWNRAAEKILGMGPDNSARLSCSDHYGLYMPDGLTLFPPEQSPLARAIRGELLTTEAFIRNQTITEGAWIEVSAGPLKDKEGAVQGGVAAFRDISERKESERKIQKLNDELEIRVMARTAELKAANQELEAFSYSVSHDLRAPLRHIGGFSQILVEEYGQTLDPVAQRYLDRIQTGTQKMGVLVDELLNLARVGRHGVRRQPTELAPIIEEVVATLEPESQGRAVKWEIGRLPVAECDPVLVKQIFQNLLANALKFTRPRSVAVIEVSQAEMADDGETVYSVRDNGVGFSMKYADKLFGVFQRLHQPADFEGTGIGLATVQRIVHKHGGRVWAEAEIDRGATFFFTLGVGREAAAKSNGARAGGQS